VIGPEKTCGTYFHMSIVRANKLRVNVLWVGLQVRTSLESGCYIVFPVFDPFEDTFESG